MAAVALGRCGWAATVRPVDLRCEYEHAPLAVESDDTDDGNTLW